MVSGSRKDVKIRSYKPGDRITVNEYICRIILDAHGCKRVLNLTTWTIYSAEELNAASVIWGIR